MVTSITIHLHLSDWPRRKAVAEFRLCVEHDCLGTHFHRTGIRPEPYCMLCSLHETTDRNRLGQCTALSSGTECERHWEARTKMMENWLRSFSVTIFVTTAYHYLLWMFFLFCIYFFLFYCSIYSVILIFYFYWSHKAVINSQCTCH